MRNGQKVLVAGVKTGRFVRMERKVEGRRWVTVAMVRHTPGGALFPYTPSIVKAV